MTAANRAQAGLASGSFFPDTMPLLSVPDDAALHQLARGHHDARRDKDLLMTPLNMNGYTYLPDSKIALVVTFLEMTGAPAGLAAPKAPAGVSLERFQAADLDGFLKLFRKVGEEWLWFSRLIMPREKLAAILCEPSREVWIVRKDGVDAGLLELDFADPQDVELSFFGLTREVTGQGLGRWLMQEALWRAWSRPQTKRFFVHTCTGDSPVALGFYQASGFRPYKRAVEVIDDPRLAGHLPETAAPHVPVLGRLAD